MDLNGHSHSGHSHEQDHSNMPDLLVQHGQDHWHSDRGDICLPYIHLPFMLYQPLLYSLVYQ